MHLGAFISAISEILLVCFLYKMLQLSSLDQKVQGVIKPRINNHINITRLQGYIKIPDEA